MAHTATYLGFAGHGNLGDDAILDVYRERFPSVSLWRIPVRRKDVARSRLLGEFHAHRHAPMIIGGGTLLGRTLWRHHLRRSTRLLRTSSFALLGAGVEDPDFFGDRVYTSPEELALWPAILRDFGQISVRGPRSQEILASVGVDASVVGDPALLLGPSTLDDTVNASGPIIVNLTHGEDQWGGSDLDWSRPIVRTLSSLQRVGHRIEFVSLERADVAVNLAALSALGLDETHHHRPNDASELLNLFGRARVVIGTRLHACVLAVAAGVPTFALEYRPKCRDFMASVDAERFCLRVDRLNESILRERIDELLTHSTQQLARQNVCVATLRSALVARIDLIGKSILS